MSRPWIAELALRIALGVVLLGVAFGVYRFRRHVIRQFFHDAQQKAAPPKLPQGPETGRAPGLGRAERVRVVLIDGVSRHTAATLPNYESVCAGGLAMTVDVGFPSVSLPVQHVLWTGLTQEQSGVLFRLKALPTPPAFAIPAKVSSRAVAESHPYIIASFGFGEAVPKVAPAAEDAQTWPERFEAEAVRAVAGDAQLVFVHVLRVDTAGHRHGRDSDAYRVAAAEADALLGALMGADAAHARDTRWFVLSDHGHRARGGHGGVEPDIRLVRACVAGALPARAEDLASRGERTIHLIDLSRALADSLGVTPAPDAVGRPLEQALDSRYAPILPSPGPWQWIAAILVIALGVVVTGTAANRRTLRLPIWLGLAVASVFLLESMPTLSTPMTYQGKGRIIYMAALPGLGALALALVVDLYRGAPGWTRTVRAVTAQLALVAALAVACLVLCGGGHLLVGISGDPPLMPHYTALASLGMTLLFSSAAVAGIAVLCSSFVLATVGRGVADTTSARPG